MTFIDDLRDSIDGRLTAAQDEIAALEAALVALRDEPVARRAAAPQRPARSAAPPARRGRPGRKPAAAPTPEPASPEPAAPSPGTPPSQAGTAEALAVADAPAPEPVATPAPAPKAAPAPAATPAPPRAARDAAPSRGAAGELSSEHLTELLAASTDGLSAISLAKQSGAGYNAVLALLRKLEAEGDVRRTGTRRTSLWRLVTDEERIAERAAELAARSS